MGMIEFLAWGLGACFLVGLASLSTGIMMSHSRVHALTDLLNGCGLAMTGIGGAGLLFILQNWPPR